jgi:4-hydroxy-tetrahydrodipicolinate reductase
MVLARKAHVKRGKLSGPVNLMSKLIRVIQYGLGAIGRAAARLVLERPRLQLVGAVDRDPKLVGRDLGEVLGLKRKLGIIVGETLPAADAVIHCTTSNFEESAAQISEIARAGMHCVTSCEEALFPYYRHRALAEKLNDLCARHGVAVVGTGVNPGFVMDTLAVVATAVCRRVDAVRVLRIVDAGTRREALQRKVGAGLTEAEFHRLAQQKKIRHVGLAESLAFVADALGWNLERVEEEIAPVLSSKDVRTERLTVKRNAVAGVRQIARGACGGKEVLTLELQMYVGAPNPRDEIHIDGDPPLHLVMHGGTPGDIATPAILVNMIPRLLEAKPGLHTMRTLALPHFTA